MKDANMKKITGFIALPKIDYSLFIIPYSLFLILYSLFLILPSPSFALSLESYCKNGYYIIPGEDQCSRAPKCGGKSYDDVKDLPQPNPQACMDGKEPQKNGCAGYVPLCCYEVERLRDPAMCIGYWERLWCTPSQCTNLDPAKEAFCNGGSGNCMCSHAFGTYCGDKPPVPLETRLGMQTPPTPLPTKIPPTTIPPTTIPTKVIPPTVVPTKVILPTTIPTQSNNYPTHPPFVNPTQTPQNYPTITSYLQPTNSEIPINIGIGIFQASIKDLIANTKISITKTAIASKKVLDLPGFAGEKILSLDQWLEMFINMLIEQIRKKFI